MHFFYLLPVPACLLLCACVGSIEQCITHLYHFIIEVWRALTVMSLCVSAPAGHLLRL